MSADTNSICLQRSSPKASRNASTVRRSRPAAAHTSRPVSWSTTTVRYRCPLRCDISSIPTRRRPASRSISRWASQATRSRIPPTLRHAIRISSATAVFEQLTASQQTWSSNARVNRQPCLAHGTAQTTTPWRRHVTLGASASTNASVVPRSSARQRRRPSPKSNPGDRRRQIPQRSRSRHDGRAQTTTSPSSPIPTPSMTARCRPSRRAHTLVPRTSSPLPSIPAVKKPEP
jgi:hypothetical protein